MRLHRIYTSLDIFIRKIASGSEEAVCLLNAKRKPHFVRGKFGVDHVEALLGWFIYLTWQYMLNQVSFSAWVLGTFFPSGR